MPFPTRRDLHNPGIKAKSLAPPALAGHKKLVPWSLNEARVGGLGWSGAFVCPRPWLCCVQYPTFAPSTSGVTVSLQLLSILLFLIASAIQGYSLPVQLLLVPYSFFLFCCWRRHLSRCNCKHSGKGPQVPSLAQF